MEKTWKPVVGGTLNIISGVANILISIFYIIIFIASSAMDQFYISTEENTGIIILIIIFLF